jgi:hypothetical protein
MRSVWVRDKVVGVFEVTFSCAAIKTNGVKVVVNDLLGGSYPKNNERGRFNETIEH